MRSVIMRLCESFTSVRLNMFAKHLFVFSILSGALVLQNVAQDVPFPSPGHPVVPHIAGQHQEPSGPLDRPDVPSGDHAHIAPASHNHNLHHTDFFHSVLPAPEPTVSNYIATLSYGEGYPTVIYHCSLTEHKPTTPFVYSPNGHVCTVSFLKDPGYFHAHDDERNHEPHKNPLTVLLDMILPPRPESKRDSFPIPIPVPVPFA